MSPRLPPPDIVLLVEDQESHEIKNVTLCVAGDYMRSPDREKVERRGKF